MVKPADNESENKPIILKNKTEILQEFYRFIPLLRSDKISPQLQVLINYHKTNHQFIMSANLNHSYLFKNNYLALPVLSQPLHEPQMRRNRTKNT